MEWDCQHGLPVSKEARRPEWAIALWVSLGMESTAWASTSPHLSLKELKTQPEPRKTYPALGSSQPVRVGHDVWATDPKEMEAQM